MTITTRNEYTLEEDTPTRPWADLPRELLSPMAEPLIMVDLLSFRGVCKSWRASASLATAKDESMPGRHPWFLVYNSHSCLLLRMDKYRKPHLMSIPELEGGATCMASSQGWLLLSKQDSLFFFCPFSRSRIDIPRLPLRLSELSDPVAAFSAPPTSKDCIVCVPHRNKASGVLEMFLLHRGHEQWTKHELGHPDATLGSLTCATYYNGEFCFRDKGTGYVSFGPQDKNMVSYSIVDPSKGPDEAKRIVSYKIGSIYGTRLPFAYWENPARNWMKQIKDLLGYDENDVSLSTCGTMALGTDPKHDVYIVNETVGAQLPGSSHLRGMVPS